MYNEQLYKIVCIEKKREQETDLHRRDKKVTRRGEERKVYESK
jgi:hypothetical protein